MLARTFQSILGAEADLAEKSSRVNGWRLYTSFISQEAMQLVI